MVLHDYYINKKYFCNQLQINVQSGLRITTKDMYIIYIYYTFDLVSK